MVEDTFLWFRILLMLTASRPLFLKSSFRKSRVGVSFGETIWTGLYNLNLATSKMIATSLYSGEFWTYVFVFITSFCKERSLVIGSWYSLVRIWWSPNGCCTYGRRVSNATSAWKLRPIVVPMSMTYLASLRAAKEPHHIDRAVSWAGKIPYRIYSIIATIWCCSTNSLIQNSSPVYEVLRLGLLVGWYIFSRIYLKDKIEWSGRLKCWECNWGAHDLSHIYYQIFYYVVVLSFHQVYQSTEWTLHITDNISGLTTDSIPAPSTVCFISTSTRKLSFFDQKFADFTSFWIAWCYTAVWLTVTKFQNVT